MGKFLLWIWHFLGASDTESFPRCLPLISSRDSLTTRNAYTWNNLMTVCKKINKSITNDIETWLYIMGKQWDLYKRRENGKGILQKVRLTSIKFNQMGLSRDKMCWRSNPPDNEMGWTSYDTKNMGKGFTSHGAWPWAANTMNCKSERL